MKKYILSIALLLLSAVCITACSETDDPGTATAADWQKQNEAYMDSLKSVLPAGRILSTREQIEAVPVGELFALIDPLSSTQKNTPYIYCKKISADNPDGESPLFTSAVRVFYYGTFINGTSFDGNFSGYGALDNGVLSATDPSKVPTEDDVPADFLMNGLVPGWQWALQFMHTGERWMLYLSYYSGYGAEGKGLVPGYSTIVFDVQLEKVLYE
jgi:FKBP-type peptidyl-prolyl cis-trans isomerase FklB